MENTRINISTYRQMRKADVILLYIALITSSIFSTYFPKMPESISMVWMILFSSLTTAICTVDAKIKGKPLIGSYKLLLFLTSGIGLSVYMIFTRKTRGLILLVKHALWLLAILLPLAIILNIFIPIPA